MAKKQAAFEQVDPTLRTAEVTIKEKKLTLCFDLRTMAAGEAELNKLGHQVDLFASLPVDNVQSVITVFAIALRRFHPEIPFEEAIGMLDIPDIYLIRPKVIEAWVKSMPEPDPEKKPDPIQPGQ